jgi:fused signal recognition particle receptor
MSKRPPSDDLLSQTDYIPDSVYSAVLPAPAAPEAPPATESAEGAAKSGWLNRLGSGLKRTSSKLSQGISDLFTKRKLDEAALEELEELLLSTDLGVATAGRVVAALAKSRFNQEIAPDEIRRALADEVAAVLEPVARPFVPDRRRKPHVVLVVGVNGSGKTTTIGKLAKFYRDQGLAVTLAAGDTFRAAAVEQLKVWGERAGCPVIARDQGADAAGLAFDALVEARRRGDDLLLIDTAGRLQNKADLMAELQKIVRVLRKQDPEVPHDVLLILDATVGQNAHSQVDIFKEMIGVSGLVVTKLDGTARGGVLVALAERFKLPVHAIGIGESADDLRPFEAMAFARRLVGLE